ncbi:MAG: hypothetical protein GY810_25190 [Aureispira sp.]|nr:hypothetical protein [Aureispira sp.]
MMHKITAFLFGLMLMLTACGGETTETNSTNTVEGNPTSILTAQSDSLYQLVIVKHDEVMPKTADIARLQEKLRKALAKLGEGPKTPERDTILNMLSKLEQADEAMMQWMRDFKSVEVHEDHYVELPETEILYYLKEEETKIEDVAKKMLSSIATAKSWTETNE